MKAFLLGLIIGLAAVPAVVYWYFASGQAPVASSSAPMPWEKMLSRKALHARLAREMPKSVPLEWDESNLTQGAVIYGKNCAVCHGLPGQPETPIAQGMYPNPPKLTEGRGVTDDPPQQTYWTIRGGIRLSGMPGFKATLADREIWQVSLMLANADKLPLAAKQVLSRSGNAEFPAPKAQSK